MSIADHDDGCACDDCRVARARRHWDEKWCRRTNRMPGWANREDLTAAQTQPGQTGRRPSDH
jgi:hypothetical protein